VLIWLCSRDEREFVGTVYHKVSRRLETAVQMEWTAGSNDTKFAIAAKYCPDFDTTYRVCCSSFVSFCKVLNTVMQYWKCCRGCLCHVYYSLFRQKMQLEALPLPRRNKLRFKAIFWTLKYWTNWILHVTVILPQACNIVTLINAGKIWFVSDRTKPLTFLWQSLNYIPVSWISGIKWQP